MAAKKMFTTCRCLMCGNEEIYLLGKSSIRLETDCTTCSKPTMHKVLKRHSYAEVNSMPGRGWVLKEVNG